jgi:hypothetical protein
MYLQLERLLMLYKFVAVATLSFDKFENHFQMLQGK